MLLWIEGFESFGTSLGSAPSPTGVVGRKYPLAGQQGSLDIMSGRLGGYALKFRWDNDCFISPGNLTTDATLIVGFALQFGTGYPAYPMFLAFYDGATLGMNLRLNASGTLSVRRGTTTLATTPGTVINLGQWHYLEFKVVCNDTTGSYDVHIGEVSVLSDTGIDTKAGANNYHTTFRLTGTGTTAGKAMQVDDLYALDGTGVQNNFLGNMRVVVLRPDASGDFTQWTPSSGNNYECVDEVIVNDDTDYVEDDTSTQKDLHNYGGISAGIFAGIKGVQIDTGCRETDATSFDLKTLVKSVTTESADSGQAIGGTSYTTLLRIVELDPHTAAAWTVAGLNAAQFGYEVG